jgi:hypothetical protein
LLQLGTDLARDCVQNMPKSGPNSIKFVSKGRPMSVQTKAAVTVAEMARMTGLSRARFYQLIGSAFPYPVYSVFTRRPFFDEEAQQMCLEVKRRNCGIDGKPILFYSRRVPTPVTKRPAKVALPKCNYNELLDGLRSLGLPVSAAQVESAVTKLFPSGTQGVDQAEVVRSIFIHIKQAA